MMGYTMDGGFAECAKAFGR